MPFIVIYKPKDALNIETQYFGPFADYAAAEDKLCELPPASECEHKFIQELIEAPLSDREALIALRSAERTILVRAGAGQLALQIFDRRTVELLAAIKP